MVESQGIFCLKNKGNKLIHYPIKKPNNVSYLEIDYTNTIWVGYKGEDCITQTTISKHSTYLQIATI